MATLRESLRSGRGIAGFGLAVFVVAFAVAWALHDPREVLGVNDPAQYWRMADGETVRAPWGYRILVPGLVGLLPVDHHVGFVFWTAVAVAVLATALLVWLRHHTSTPRALAGTAIVLASGPVWSQLHSPYRNDASMMAFLALAALASDRRRWGAFALVGVLAVLTRDLAVVIAVVPVLAFWRDRNSRALLAAAAVVVAFVVVHTAVPVVPRALQSPDEIFRFRAVNDGGLGRAVFLAFGVSFGAAWLLVPAAWKRLDANTREWAVVAVLTFPILFVASDWSRYLAPAFPLVAMAAVRSRAATGALAVTALLMTAANARAYPSFTVVFVSTALSALVLFVWRRPAEAEASEDAVDDHSHSPLRECSLVAGRSSLAPASHSHSIVPGGLLVTS